MLKVVALFLCLVIFKLDYGHWIPYEINCYNVLLILWKFYTFFLNIQKDVHNFVYFILYTIYSWLRSACF